jgi:hypothetical protein
MVQQALRGALSDRAGAGQVFVVDGWDFDLPSTKAARAALEALGITGKAMVVLSRGDERAFKSFRNLSEVDIVLSGELAAYDVLCSDSLIFTRQTLPGDSSWAEAVAVTIKQAPAGRPVGPEAPVATAEAADGDATDDAAGAGTAQETALAPGTEEEA